MRHAFGAAGLPIHTCHLHKAAVAVPCAASMACILAACIRWPTHQPLPPPSTRPAQDPEELAWHAAFHRLRRAKAEGVPAPTLLASAAALAQGPQEQPASSSAQAAGPQGGQGASAPGGLDPTDLVWLQRQRMLAAEEELSAERRRLLERLLGLWWAA